MVIGTAVIAVAGLGIRMKPYSDITPKELLEVGGKPVLDYVVKEAIESGASNLVFITNKKKQTIDKYIESLDISGIHIQSIRQKENLPGFGGAVLSVKNEIDGPFMLLTGDSIFLNNNGTGLSLMGHDYEKHGKCVVGLSAVLRTEVSKYGIIDGEHICSGLISIGRMIEKPQNFLKENALAMNGRYILDKTFFEAADGKTYEKDKEIPITDILKEMNLLGRITEDTWLDTGTIEGWRNAQRVMSEFTPLIPKI